MQEVFGIDGLVWTLPHCNRMYVHKSTKTRWEGDYEISTAWLVCPTCGSDVHIEVRMRSPKP